MKKTSGGRHKTPFGKAGKLRSILVLLIGFTLFQYLVNGEVSWPIDLYHQVRDTLSEYAGRPQASWRKATDALDELGATREGQSAPSFDLRGRVVRIADGDTLSLLDASGAQTTIRLYGIDTPERDQRYGKSAHRALARLVSSKSVGVVAVEIDDYGRTVGTVYLDNININLAMVEGGHAWWYRKYAPYERHLAAAEQAARKAQRGLWSHPDPIPPWKWRWSHR